MIKIEPINPTKYDTDIESVILKLRNNYLKLNPEYQRGDDAWLKRPELRPRFIESLIYKLPVPPIFVAEESDGIYEVIDGLQRLTAIKDFADNKLNLSQLEFDKSLQGLRYSTLPPDIKRHFNNASMPFYSIPKNHPKWGTELINIVFSRLNSGQPLRKVESVLGRDNKGYFRDMSHRLNRIILGHAEVNTDPKQVGAAFALMWANLAHRNTQKEVIILGYKLITSIDKNKKMLSELLNAHINSLSDAARFTFERECEDLIDLIVSKFGKLAFFRTYKSNRVSDPATFIQAYTAKHNTQNNELDLLFVRANATLPQNFIFISNVVDHFLKIML